ncbi:hypothetical protein RCL1_002148 [Eukaryota sp. TZLM3-RCL]
MPFGQLVIGPPGTGKSTYCYGVQQFLSQVGRKVVIVNLDPANDSYPYPCDIDIRSLISVSDLMSNEELGPNGALLYSFSCLEASFDWLKDQLSLHSDAYFVFDFPGQVELFTEHTSLRNITSLLEKLGYRLVCVNLIDSYCCVDPSRFISAVLVSLTEMLHLELPHVNVLSKIDLLGQYLPDDTSLETFTEVVDLSTLLLSHAEIPLKYKKLNSLLADLLEEFGLVSFLPLDVSSKELMYEVLKKCDQAICYPYPLNFD